MKKKKGDKKMNATVMESSQTTNRRKKVQDSFAKAVKANGKALEKLSKN